MAAFTVAYAIVMVNEGGWANNPNDKGGETYRGIARKFHPNWRGWSIVDAAKTGGKFVESKLALLQKQALNVAVKDFYKAEFWDKMGGDYLTSQEVATRLFDMAVNLGLGEAGRNLQMELNARNVGEKAGADLKIDGVIGTATVKRLNDFLKTGAGLEIEKSLRALQRAHYLHLAANSPSQRAFYVGGWSARS